MLSLLLVALLTSGCSDDAPRPAPTASATATTISSATPTSAARAELMVLAVTSTDRSSVTVYRVDATRHATTLRTLRLLPGWHAIDDVQLTSARDPLVCLTHQKFDSSKAEYVATMCYPPGDNKGFEVPFGQGKIALSRDGRRLLGLNSVNRSSERANRYLYLSQIGAPTDTAQLGSADVSPVAPPCYDVADLGWSGDAYATFECTGGDGKPPVTVVEQLRAVTNGDSPGDGPVLRPQGQLGAGYDRFTGVTPLSASEAIGLMHDCPQVSCAGSRMVRLRLPDGAVLETIATAAAGRLLVDLSGGEHGIVYFTATTAGKEVRVQVRWPGEEHGQRVTGLPATFAEVTGQH